MAMSRFKIGDLVWAFLPTGARRLTGSYVDGANWEEVRSWRVGVIVRRPKVMCDDGSVTDYEGRAWMLLAGSKMGIYHESDMRQMGEMGMTDRHKAYSWDVHHDGPLP